MKPKLSNQEVLEMLAAQLQYMSDEHIRYVIRILRPYAFEIENAVERVKFGTVDAKITVRAGTVAKVQFFETRDWMPEKDSPPQT